MIVRIQYLRKLKKQDAQFPSEKVDISISVIGQVSSVMTSRQVLSTKAKRLAFSGTGSAPSTFPGAWAF